MTFTRKEEWLHSLLRCLYNARGDQEILAIFDIVTDSDFQDKDEMGGEILDFLYLIRMEQAEEVIKE